MQNLTNINERLQVLNDYIQKTCDVLNDLSFRTRNIAQGLSHSTADVLGQNPFAIGIQGQIGYPHQSVFGGISHTGMPFGGISHTGMPFGGISHTGVPYGTVPTMGLASQIPFGVPTQMGYGVLPFTTGLNHTGYVPNFHQTVPNFTQAQYGWQQIPQMQVPFVPTWNPQFGTVNPAIQYGYRWF